jgi:hypothetical protein
VTPIICCAPPKAKRNPETTSSKIKIVPFFSHNVFSLSKKSFSGGIKETGSNIKQAIC